ncbi:MAG: hypothetical protein COX77_04710 [Candidatus Komeilibacteria bacterium CG_4_10_14_0_2_um_filter_37_10]|uniref:Uncharacterized protein n=1 Tax=Candidatus Komeilibacteria bacterium CG_4_10_14_0_2_um_filter_37_10 TaxID=1974470 RepID=A0A2M7VDE0_9BACT|nr:MAG: hypothetical protein COX77_04710 [Candidatus Komeilibacteria bacterium CG_4_10_14_0_2_um_filter_37_10]PJA92607.1 MAG: hypothetical protein CO133_02275 [Candidatus Komeilibacteria bacterium CG_4_9_14_3_um_filter_37_5]
MIKKITAKQVIVTVALIAVCFILLPHGSAQALAAKERIQFVPQITIPNSSFTAGKEISVASDTLPNYINAIYKYGISVTAVLAVVMLMLGGFRWIFAGGDSGAIGSAKNTIKGALIGLVLVLVAVLMLNTINPELTDIELNKPPTPDINLSCPGVVTSCNDINKLNPPNDSERERYKKKYGDAWWKGYQMEMCNKYIYVDKCQTLPYALCYWGTEIDASTPWRYMMENNKKELVIDPDVYCRSIINKPCSVGGNKDPQCNIKFADFDPAKTGTTQFDGSFNMQTKQLYCNTDGSSRCSLGALGSKCDNSAQCGYIEATKDTPKIKLVCQTCDEPNRCVKPLRKGDVCGSNEECQASISTDCDNLTAMTCGKCK